MVSSAQAQNSDDFPGSASEISLEYVPDRPRGLRQRLLSIRWVLPIMMVAPLITGIGLTGVLAYRSGQAVVDELTQEVGNEITERIEQRLQDRLRELIIINDVVAADFRSGELTLNQPEKLRQELWQLAQLTNVGNATAIIYGTPKNEFTGIKRLQDGTHYFYYRDASMVDRRTVYPLDARGNIAGPSRSEPYKLFTRTWYTNAIAAQNSIWSDAYISIEPRDLTITRTTPLRNGAGDVIGVVGIDVYLESLSRFLGELKIGKTGEAFIIERSGELVATSVGNPFIEDGGEQQRITAANSEAPLVSQTAALLLKEYSSFDAIQKTTTVLREGNQVVQVRVLPFQESGLDWLVVVAIPQSDFMESIQANRQRTLIMGSIITGAAALLSVLLSRWLVRPIARLNQAATDITQNQYDLDDLADVAARPDELGTLASLFNDMAMVVLSREQGLTEQVASLRSEIARYGSLNPEQARSLTEVLQRSQRVRQAYQQRQSTENL